MKAIAAITAMAITVPESRTRAGECLRGLRSRMERSTRAQEIQAQSEIIEPMARARIEIALRVSTAMSKVNALSAIPPAINAKPVLIQARKVRSFASVNRGSGSLP